MFQKEDVDAYKNIKAPEELKGRIMSSIEVTQKRSYKQSAALLATAASIALFILCGTFVFRNHSILMVDDQSVNYKAVRLENTNARLSVANMKKDVANEIRIPLEIQCKEALVTVSEGFLQTMDNSTMESENKQRMQITKDSVIYWYLNGNNKNSYSCTIVTEQGEFVYLVEYDSEETIYTIRQKRNNEFKGEH